MGLTDIMTLLGLCIGCFMAGFTLGSYIKKHK